MTHETFNISSSLWQLLACHDLVCSSCTCLFSCSICMHKSALNAYAASLCAACATLHKTKQKILLTASLLMVLLCDQQPPSLLASSTSLVTAYMPHLLVSCGRAEGIVSRQSKQLSRKNFHADLLPQDSTSGVRMFAGLLRYIHQIARKVLGSLH